MVPSGLKHDGSWRAVLLQKTSRVSSRCNQRLRRMRRGGRLLLEKRFVSRGDSTRTCNGWLASGFFYWKTDQCDATAEPEPAADGLRRAVHIAEAVRASRRLSWNLWWMGRGECIMACGGGRFRRCCCGWLLASASWYAVTRVFIRSCGGWVAAGTSSLASTAVSRSMFLWLDSRECPFART